MEQTSLTSFWISFVLAGLSAALYVAYGVGVRVGLKQLATETGHSFPVLVLERIPRRFGVVASSALWAAAAADASSVLFRWLAVGHAPWSNMWEYTVALSGAIMLSYLLFERWHRQRTMGAFVVPMIVALMAVAVLEFPPDVHPLVPALQSSDILALHVGVLILAYGAFSVSFAAGIMYIAQGGKRRRFPSLPEARVLDNIGFRSVTVGFPLLSAGIALGAYWANHAWGTYWNWDPKETSILVSWLIYGVYLHTHGLRRWSGGRSAGILVVGYASILFSYFVVNLYVAGLHSYAGV